MWVLDIYDTKNKMCESASCIRTSEHSGPIKIVNAMQGNVLNSWNTSAAIFNEDVRHTIRVFKCGFKFSQH